MRMIWNKAHAKMHRHRLGSQGRRGLARRVGVIIPRVCTLVPVWIPVTVVTQ